jgi:cation:H+ antiporter
LLTYLLLIAGFFLLIKGASILIEGASSIAKKLNISNLVIGLTIVAFGTSTPELFVNISASLKGNTEIAIGNILGSNIANILLILGVSSIIYPISIRKTTLAKEIPFSLLAAIVLAILVNDKLIDNRDFSELSAADGIILIAFFSIFIYYVIDIARQNPENAEEVKSLKTWKAIIYIITGVAGLAIGGNWIVEGAIKVAGNFGLSESFIGLTVVAIGTSLPELATSAVAAYKKNPDIAVGNVVGSNIFNIFWVLAVSAIIKPLPFQPKSNVDVLMTIITSLLLFALLFASRKRTLGRWQGWLFLAIYIGYIIFLAKLE